MMWQKARIVASTPHPEMIGREFWIKAIAPVIKRTRDVESGDRLPAEPVFDANFVDERKRSITVAPKGLELLPEFAEDVPIISWEDFINEHKQN